MIEKRVRALPASPTPRTVYFVRPDGSESVRQYITGETGPPVPVVSDASAVDPGDLILYFENGLA